MNQDHKNLIENLATRSELAIRYKVPHSTVEGWIERKKSNGFPDPVKKSKRGSTSYYWIPDTDEWFEAYSRTRMKYRGSNGTTTN